MALSRTILKHEGDQTKEAHNVTISTLPSQEGNDKDIGHNSKLKHGIHTGDAKPIRQSTRHLQPLKDKVGRLLDEMQKHNLIESSSRPWASPIVLVPKKDGSWSTPRSAQEVQQFLGFANYYRKEFAEIAKPLHHLTEHNSPFDRTLHARKHVEICSTALFVHWTDHNSLARLNRFNEPEGQISRWLEHRQEYNFEVAHRKGRNHRNADALPRRSVSGEEDAETARILAALVEQDRMKAFDTEGRRLIQIWDQLMVKEGQEKTLGELKERFYWPGHSTEQVQYMENISPKQRGSFQPLQTGYPMQLVAIDILGPLPESNGGNTYILVAETILLTG
eukprot:Em0005g471a